MRRLTASRTFAIVTSFSITALSLSGVES
jgi:hypothetical protein